MSTNCDFYFAIQLIHYSALFSLYRPYLSALCLPGFIQLLPFYRALHAHINHTLARTLYTRLPIPAPN